MWVVFIAFLISILSNQYVLAALSNSPHSSFITSHSRHSKRGQINPTAFDAGFNIQQVANVGMKLASHSWEHGTLAQALLELYNPDVAVYSANAFPNTALPRISPTIPSLAYARSKSNFSQDTLAPGDGSNGDPAALGVSAVLIGQTNATVKAAAAQQIKHINAAPRFYNGAISQRDAVAELWADGAHMIPPFLAYYGASMENNSMVQEAAQQLLIYRNVLIANTTESWKGLWTHIIGPNQQTLGIWCTGNGWAALGMARVLATIKNYSPTKGRLPQQQQLVDAMTGIFDGLKGVNRDNTTGLLRNYLIGDEASQDVRDVIWFGDASGSAALVAAALRLAVLEPSTCQDLYHASRNIRDAVIKSVNSTGTVSPTVNPMDWYTLVPFTAGSPEAQAFVVSMYSAWRDCVQSGCCPDPTHEKRGDNGPSTWGGASFASTHTTRTSSRVSILGAMSSSTT